MINILVYMMVFMPVCAAFVSYLIGRKSKTGRDLFVCAVAVAEFLLATLLFFQRDSSVTVCLPEVCGMGLSFTADGFRTLYAAIATFMWMMTLIFSKEYFAHYRNRNRYYFFQLLTLGATVGIFLSADLYTTFVFFEIMSLSSYVWVVQDERRESMKAGETYLAVAVIGGLVMLMGLFLLYHQSGTLVIADLYEACKGKNVYAAAICLLIGFGAKAGAFPLQIWLPKAHPVAPAPASALLSGILTKTGIFGILVISCQILLHDEKWGTLMLWIGVITMVLGAALAVFSVDFKRTLACSSVSQIGFILVGIGMQGLLGAHNELAVRGTFLHMMNHSLFKLVLFMVAGVIFMNLHKLDLNDIRGFGRKKPFLAVVYLMGALGIGGIPLWSGYVSKTLLHESIVEMNLVAVEWLFLISGGLTIAYMCKLFVAVFVEKNEDEKLQEKYDNQKSYMNLASKIALGVSAALVPIFGMLPNHTMNYFADQAQGFMGLEHAHHQVEYFAWINLKGSLISIAIGVVVYVCVVRTLLMKKNAYVNRWPKWADLEEMIYRPLLEKVLPRTLGVICGVLDSLVDIVVVVLRSTVYKESKREVELDEGNEATHLVGATLNGMERFLNHVIWRKHPHHKDFEHQMALGYSSFKENSTLIGRSLSYGLILFCLGLCFTLIYMLIAAFE